MPRPHRITRASAECECDRGPLKDRVRSAMRLQVEAQAITCRIRRGDRGDRPTFLFDCPVSHFSGKLFLGGVSVVLSASTSRPSRTPAGFSAEMPNVPAGFSADMASGGSRHADTINSDPTHPACFADLRDHAVQLMKRRGRHGMRRCCDDQGKGNSD